MPVNQLHLVVLSDGLALCRHILFLYLANCREDFCTRTERIQHIGAKQQGPYLSSISMDRTLEVFPDDALPPEAIFSSRSELVTAINDW
ncbi:hypothetical protein HZ326_30167, partial [Fusarium oxysporum f. sp. albedinis]